MFPAEPDPKGEPETWTKEQMRRWLEVVSEPVEIAVDFPNQDYLA